LADQLKTVNADNPWGLSAKRLEAMSNLVELGCNKLVARRMNLSIHTVSEHITDARKQMGASNRLTAILKFDRWRQLVVTEKKTALIHCETQKDH
jgi:DNA-binding NarL/FixJ family response regulator